MTEGNMNKSEKIIIVLMAVIIGILSGMAAVIFLFGLKWVEARFLNTGIAWMKDYGRGLIIVMPVLGGLVVGMVSKYWSLENKGFGVPEVMEAVTYKNGKMDPSIILGKTMLAIITMGTGGSAGRLGPVVQMSAGISSAVGQAVKLTKGNLLTMVSCGVAAGIAAEYNAPLAGVLFAIEVVLGRLKTTFFIPALISAVTSVLIRRQLLGSDPIFSFPAAHITLGYSALIHFTLLGILTGIVVILYIKTLYGIGDFFRNRVKIPVCLKPALGGLTVGIIGIFVPQVLGTGGIYTQNAIFGSYSLSLFVVLMIAKLVATSFTLGSGGVGGIFAPSLFMGAMLGGAFGRLMHIFDPGIGIPVSVFVVVGIGAFFSATAMAPLTSIVMFTEFTGNLELSIPLMFACAVSPLFLKTVYGYSMFTEKLKRQGMNIQAIRQVSLGDALTVEDIMHQGAVGVKEDITVGQLVEKMRETNFLGFPVLDDEGRLKGIITFDDIREALVKGNTERRITEYITRELITVNPDCPVPVALGKLNHYDIGRLLVVEDSNPEKLLGIVTRSDVIHACERIIE